MNKNEIAKKAAQENGWEFLGIYRGYAISKREKDYCYHTVTDSGFVAGHYDFVSVEAIRRVLDIAFFMQSFKNGTVISVDGSPLSGVWSLKGSFEREFDEILEDRLNDKMDFMFGWIDKDLDLCFLGVNLGSIVSIDDYCVDEVSCSRKYKIVFQDLENTVKIDITLVNTI